MRGEYGIMMIAAIPVKGECIRPTLRYETRINYWTAKDLRTSIPAVLLAPEQA